MEPRIEKWQRLGNMGSDLEVQAMQVCQKWRRDIGLESLRTKKLSPGLKTDRVAMDQNGKGTTTTLQAAPNCVAVIR